MNIVACGQVKEDEIANIDEASTSQQESIVQTVESINLETTDASGNPITAEITFSNGQAILTFTDSTWGYLENGTQYVFDKE